MLQRLAVFLSAIFLSTFANASYPTALKNANLREELRDDANRLLPVTEHFAFGVDGEAYYRLLGNQDFYHGIGYWVQARTEVAMNEYLRMNMRSVFFAGSCSYGYVDPSDQYHLLSLTAIYPEPVFGGEAKLIALDLGRQTVGYGLLIQDREFNGGQLSWTNESARVLFRADGTGVLVLGDDTYNLEAQLFGGYVGAGAIFWPGGQEQDFLAKPRDPYYYLTTGQQYENFSYGVEVGQRAGTTAALAAVGFRAATEAWTVESRLEARRYQESFGETWVGRIEHQYISYDQYDKPYTNAMNVFATDDDATVGAAQFNFTYRASEKWRFEGHNEVGRFDYAEEPHEDYYFYRYGVAHCPFEGRDDCLVPFVSNKVLRDGFARPPHTLARNNEPLFKMVPFFGLEAKFRF